MIWDGVVEGGNVEWRAVFFLWDGAIGDCSLTLGGEERSAWDAY